MTPVYGLDSEVCKWVSGRIGAAIFPPFTAIGFEKGGALVAGVVFNDYIPGGNIEMTLASDAGVKRQIIRVIADYVFRQLGCKVLSIRTKKRNKLVCDIAIRAGFKYATTIPDYFGNDSAVLFRMRRDECRWLP